MDMGGLWDFVKSLGGGRSSMVMPEQEEEEDTPLNFDFATPKTEAYLEHLRQRPAYEAPNFGRKLAAGLIGAVSGQGNAQAVLNAPNANRLRDFENAGAGLKEGADYEQKDLPNRRLSMQAMMVDNRAKKNYTLAVQKATRDYEVKMKAIQRLANKDEQDKQLAIESNKLKEKVLAARKEHDKVMEGQGASRTGAYVKSVNDQGKRLDMAYDMDKPVKPAEQLQIEKIARQDVARDPRFTPFYDPSRGGFATEPSDANGKPIKGPDGKPLIMDETTQKLLADALEKAKERAATRTRRTYTTPSDEMLAQYGFGANDNDEDDQ